MMFFQNLEFVSEYYLVANRLGRWKSMGGWKVFQILIGGGPGIVEGVGKFSKY